MNTWHYPTKSVAGEALDIEVPSALNDHREVRPPMISWASIGAVPVEKAREHALAILELCDKADEQC